MVQIKAMKKDGLVPLLSAGGSAGGDGRVRPNGPNPPLLGGAAARDADGAIPGVVPVPRVFAGRR